MGISEQQLQIQVADYLCLRYPKILFHSDYGSGVRLRYGQAIKQKRQNGGRRGWPDIFVAEPLRGSRGGILFCGLFIELKKDGTRLKKKDGSWATDHIAEQAATLEALEKAGFMATFAVGFEQAKEIIDDYLRKRKHGRW